MKAFAPGHITGFFIAEKHDDPLETGSRGAGIVIDDGVTSEVEPADETVITLNGEEIESEVVERVLDMMGVTAHVDTQGDIPIGCGFGASGAAALSTAMAANEEFDLGHHMDQVTAAAHVAEVKAGTGLGDVVPQSMGGVVTRIEEGAPGLGMFGRIDHDPETVVEYTAFGPIETSDVLSDDSVMERINRAGEESLERLVRDPSLEELVTLSWEFALETGLTTPKVEKEIRRIHQEDGVGSMAMLGESVFSVGTQNVLENKTKISEEGAGLLG